MKEISIKDIKVNPFTVFCENWMALSAGNKEDGYNTMTVGWGHFGSIWESEGHKRCLPTAICYVRPSRYTKEFIDKEDYFTLSGFDPSYKKVLGYLGSRSGKDENKIEKVGLTPVFEEGTTYFDEADIVYICRKIYHGALKEQNFIDTQLIDNSYPKRDFHEVYIGEIVKVLVKDENE